MRDELLAFLASSAFLAVSCSRTASDVVKPSPESKPTASSSPPLAPPPAPPMVLSFSDVTCQYGGTAPAFFVWVETRAHSHVHSLHATAYEIADKSGAFVSGVSSSFPIAVRVRADQHGVGDVKPLTAPLTAGSQVHLEVFGALAFTAFGPKVDYPSEDRAFRVVLVADEGTWTLTGTCVVGPSG